MLNYIDIVMINFSNVVSIVTGILGSVLGSAALAISILNYLRDQPRLKVTLQWDMSNTATRDKMGLVRVTNIGRRPAHLGIVALELPPNYKRTHLILNDSIAGKRLEEGAKPEAFLVNYEGLEQYKADWRRIRALAEDSTGRKYFSEYPNKKPSWAA
jgi:hypothetical protein